MRARKLSLAVLCVLAIGGVGAAIAFFSAPGAGAAAASVGSQSSPVVTAADGVGAIPVSWTASSVGDAAADTDILYTVQRSIDGGSYEAVGGTCAQASTRATRACSDTPQAGSHTYKYKVTATFRTSWTATGESATVTGVLDVMPTVTATPANPSADATPTFVFSAAGATSYECSLTTSGTSYAACTSPYTSTPLADGTYTFRVRAISGGTPGPASSPYTWVLDRSAPSIGTATTPGSSSNASFAFSHPTFTGFECSLDSTSAYSACTSTKSYSGIAAGEHTFRVRAVDAQGETTQIASHTWTTGGPTVTTAPAVTPVTLPFGTAMVTGTLGTYGNGASVYEWRFQRCSFDDAGACTNVASGSTGDASFQPSYALLSADTDFAIRLQVTARNADYETTTSSALTSGLERTNAVSGSYVVSGGTVKAVARVSATQTAIGGSFSAIGKWRRGAVVSATGAAGLNEGVRANGQITAAVLSGTKYYIGGTFTQIDGVTRNHLARVNADGTLDTAWTPAAITDASNNGAAAGVTVNALALNAAGSTLYVGGSFANVGGAAQANFTALTTADAGTRIATPAAGGVVRALAVSGTTRLYVGGDFATFNGVARTGLAAVSLPGNTYDTGFAPTIGASPVIRSVSVGSTNLYVGGAFTASRTSPSRTRTNLAAVNLTSGVLDQNFDALTTSEVINSVVTSGTNVLVGGGFTTINTAARNRVASLTQASGSVNAALSQASFDGVVTTIAAAGANLYVGGDFTARLAIVDAGTGASTATTSADGTPFAIAVNGTSAFVGGAFTSVAPAPRTGLAMVGTSGVSAWAPSLGTTPSVNALATDGTTVYAGGAFTSTGTVRTNLAAIDAGAGTIAAGFPQATGTVNALARTPSKLYVGGAVTALGATAVTRVGQIDLPGGTVNTGFVPAVNGTVNALALDSANLYLGGTGITSVAGTPVTNLGAVTTAGGPVGGFAPAVDNAVSALGVNGTHVYAGGPFTGNAAAFSTTSGAKHNTWAPAPNGTVSAISVSGANVYLAGAFSTLGGTARPGVGAVGHLDGARRAWNPTDAMAGAPVSAVGAIEATPGVLGLAYGGALVQTVG